MTLPQNVKDAIARSDELSGDMLIYQERDDYEAIRAHLMSQEAAITNLRSAAQKAVLANADLRVRAELAESRLAAANALISDIKEWDVGEAVRRFSPSDNGAIFILPDALRSRIQAHLQGAGDEA